MEERNGWWLMLVSLLLVAFGGVILWAVFRPEPTWTRHTHLLLVAALCIGVGVYTFFTELLREADDKSPRLLPQAVTPFIRGWKALWRTKWLLWIYGSIAAVAVLSEIVASYRNYYHGLQHFRVPASSIIERLPIDGWHLSNWVIYSMHGETTRFFARTPTMGQTPFYVLVLFAAVWWALPRVQRLATDPECQGKTGVLSVAMVAAVVFAMVEGLAWMGASPLLWQRHSAQIAVAIGQWQILGAVSSLIVVAVLQSALTGGIIGSLTREARGEGNTEPAFLKDTCCHFLPLAVLFFAVYLVEIVPDLMIYTVKGLGLETAAWGVCNAANLLVGSTTLIFPLLMFMPFGIVTRRTGLRDAFLHNVDVWRRMWRQVVSLIAVGALFCGAIELLIRVPLLLFHMNRSWISIPYDPIPVVLAIILRAWLLVSVWKFYRANVTAPEPVSETA